MFEANIAYIVTGAKLTKGTDEGGCKQIDIVDSSNYSDSEFR